MGVDAETKKHYSLEGDLDANEKTFHAKPDRNTKNITRAARKIARRLGDINF
jgi:hypothetical protein